MNKSEVGIRNREKRLNHAFSLLDNYVIQILLYRCYKYYTSVCLHSLSDTYGCIKLFMCIATVTRYKVVRTRVLMSLERESDGFDVANTSPVAANCPTCNHMMWAWW